jgi:hypothetical protein
MRRNPPGNSKGGQFAADTSGRDNVPTPNDKPRSSLDFPERDAYIAEYDGVYEHYVKWRTGMIATLTAETQDLSKTIQDDLVELAKARSARGIAVSRGAEKPVLAQYDMKAETLRAKIAAATTQLEEKNARLGELTADAEHDVDRTP